MNLGRQHKIVVCSIIALSCLLCRSADAMSSAQKLVEAARERTQHQVTYDGSYVRLSYPMGDVADNRGVCTDVVIRSFRVLGVDLQQLVHEDMSKHFAQYPQHWGLNKPDANIDHRRVPNLEMFFTRYGKSIPPSAKAQDYVAGDIVTWKLGGRLPHIGIVSDRFHKDSGVPLIIHNVGLGPKEENVLFRYPITGHFRYPTL